MNEFWWREEEIPDSESVQKDRETFKNTTLEDEQRANQVIVGYDCSDLIKLKNSQVKEIQYVVFDDKGDPHSISNEEYTTFQKENKEVYKVVIPSRMNDGAFVSKLYPGIIFVNPLFDIARPLWQNFLMHEQTHSSSPSVGVRSHTSACGFIERVKVDDKWLTKGILIEEWWAMYSQREYKVDDYEYVYNLGNRIVDLLIKLDQKDIISVFKQYGYKESYIENFQSNWETKDKRKAIIMNLIDESRNVRSSRIIFRDFLNTIDPSLFSMWFDGKIYEAFGINKKLNLYDNIKKLESQTIDVQNELNLQLTTARNNLT